MSVYFADFIFVSKLCEKVWYWLQKSAPNCCLLQIGKVELNDANILNLALMDWCFRLSAIIVIPWNIWLYCRTCRISLVRKYLLSVIFIPISNMEKRYTNLGQNGDEIWEIVDIGIDMYIYSWSGRKKKTFSKNVCPSVRPSVRAQK